MRAAGSTLAACLLAAFPTVSAFQQRPSQYRKIDVRVTRGLAVRARRGYLALQPSMMLVPKPVK